MVDSPFLVGGDTEVSHHEHAFLVPQFHDLGQEVVLQSRLLGNDSILVPCIAVIGNAEGLDDIRADRLVPRHMLRRIGIGPSSRAGEGLAFAVGHRPVEVEAVGLDVLDRSGVRGAAGGRRFGRGHRAGKRKRETACRDR